MRQIWVHVTLLCVIAAVIVISVCGTKPKVRRPSKLPKDPEQWPGLLYVHGPSYTQLATQSRQKALHVATCPPTSVDSRVYSDVLHLANTNRQSI